MSVVDMFTNRVKKNARHLAKWAKREHVTCYRVYDRDIPEVPVTLDTYEGSLVLNDYRIDGSNRAWLDDLAAASQSALDAKECFAKQRERFTHREGDQYERQAEQGAWRTVHEGGHKFRVNLSDYIDTGLFLDHRITRARAAAEPGMTSMLNLYCYTGAFTVYCGAAGMQTTSVDLSNTY